ncbi:MAG TPA: prephenate dehydrogenase [Candidatus Saccharimonadales bacterium]|nr:prephenate dehydrogenase [Candidatus Saccharimonadales bacterium]
MTRLGSVAIVGTGQVGTMVGSALRAAAGRAGISSVSLFDVEPAVASAALALGAGDRVLTDPESVLSEDVVILAMPVGEIVAWLDRFGDHLRRSQLLLDTGSAKTRVVAAMREHVNPTVWAIGGHPMAGNEASGPAAAESGALTGATFVLSPVRRDRVALQRATELVRACAAVPLVIDAEAHDHLVARTSHLPHLVSSALANLAITGGAELTLARALAGSGYRSSTRLAASEPAMVAEFLDANRKEVQAALDDFRRELDRLAEALDLGPAALEAALAVARAGRALVLDGAPGTAVIRHR